MTFIEGETEMKCIEVLEQHHGYLFRVEGDKITYERKSNIPSDTDKVKALFEQVKRDKVQALAYFRSRAKSLGEKQAVDIETTSLDPRKGRIVLVATSGGSQNRVYDSPEDIRSILQDADILKVFHNAAFDVYWLEMKGYVVNNYTDTMVMAQVLSNNQGEHSLASIAEKKLGMKLDKALQKEANWRGEVTEAHRTYCMRDADATYLLAGRLLEEIERLQLTNVLQREIRALPAIIRLQRDGIPFDKSGWLQALGEKKKTQVELEQQIRLELGTSLNLNSPKQLLESLRNRGIPVRDTSDDSLAEVQHVHPVVKLIRDWRAFQKLTSSTGEKWLDHCRVDGRIYAGWRLIGATTGRMSCSNPNLQQVPHLLRPYFKATEGHMFVIADYSQIELRVVAAIAQEREMLQAFKNGEDLHQKTARMILNRSEISKAERQVAKAANFGLIYGMTTEGLQNRVRTQFGLQLTRKEAEAFRSGFFRHYRAIRRYHEKQLVRNQVQTIGGRVWTDIPKPPQNGWRNRFNYAVQGTAAEGLKESLPLLLARIPAHWKLCALVHDEVVLEVPASESDQASQVVRQAMVEGMQKMLPGIPIDVDVKVSDAWVKE